MLIDFHAHLASYPQEELEPMLQRAREAGVGKILAVSNTMDSCSQTLRVAALHDGVYPAVGLHPWHTGTLTRDTFAQLQKLAGDRSVAAMGEIGLDFARAPDTKEAQLRIFKYQMELARDLGLPVIIHTRGAHQETIRTLEASNGVTGAIHGFAGDKGALNDWLKLGLYISLGIHILNAEATALRELVKSIPDDKLLIETDTTPNRTVSEGLEPAKAAAVAKTLAELKGIKLSTLEEIIAANFKRILKVP